MIKNRTIIYNLGRRGFFSEINNLALAIIYANKHNCKIKVNSTYWNCRLKKGLRDYFDLNLNECNNVFSAQMVRAVGTKSFNLHSIFYYFTDLMNFIYSLFNPNVIFARDIYCTIREQKFINTISSNEFCLIIRNILSLNSEISNRIDKTLADIDLPKSYLGVHIRRGDKITTGEMDCISLEKYISAIKDTKINNVYLATDDISTINYITAELVPLGYKIYSNPCMKSKGFNEGDFNKLSRRIRYSETVHLLEDIYILTHSDYFIGTYSSNLSRIIPCFKEHKDCISLDKKWFIG